MKPIHISLSICIILVFVLSGIFTQAVQAAGVRYAKSIASGRGDCTDWANAGTLQTALTKAMSGDQIWVMAGLHKPTTLITDRAATFQLKGGVAVYGGFAGTETARDQRDPAANLTILSGDIDNNDNQTPIITDIKTVTGNTTNTYHVVTGANGATLDGFIITAGNADGNACPTGCGGGMYDSSAGPTVTNVTFSGNSAGLDGGGMYNATGSSPTIMNVTLSSNSAYRGGGMANLTSSSPTVTNVTFRDNLATWDGGGMYNYQSSPLVTNVTFSGNSTAWYGGGMANLASSNPTVTNVTFSGNAAAYGGGMYNVGESNPTLTNVTFSGNSAGNFGGGMRNLCSSPTVRNTILWGNTAAGAGAQVDDDASSPVMSDSIVQGGFEGGTNIVTADPRLGTLGNYGGFTQTIPLLPGSSAIDVGNDAYCPATDQRGEARPQRSHCDIGAFEHIGSFSPVGKWTPSFDLSHGWTVSDFVRTAADINGDGKGDLIGFGLDGVYVALSTGNGFSGISKWSSAFDLSHGWTVSDYVRTVGDVSGDGKADLVGFGLDGVYVALSTGNGFSGVGKWTSSFDLSHSWTVNDYVRTVGDVNGDGKADLVGFGLDGVYVALSNGGAFGAISKWTGAFDLSHGWTVSQYVRTVGDVNGDGKADLIGCGLDGVYVALSNGSRFNPVTKWTSAFDLSHGWTVSQYVRTVSDVNGDGRADLVGFGLDGVYVALSSGSGFFGLIKWTSAFDLSHDWTVSDFVRMVGDVSGDGKGDLVGFGLDGVYIALAQ